MRRRWHVMSRVVAAMALLVSGPLLLLAALAVKVSSRGPVLFTATRVGELGRPFTIMKLRTMHVYPTGAPVPSRITGAGDARIYPLGHWLRRLKIDELPQLANILRGDMVVVGPRPEDPSIVSDHYTALMRETLTMPPGLTSPGSLDYFSAETTLPRNSSHAEALYLAELLPRKTALDLVYVRNRTWRYDTEVVIRTAASLLGVPYRLFPRHRAWEEARAQELLASADVGVPIGASAGAGASR